MLDSEQRREHVRGAELRGDEGPAQLLHLLRLGDRGLHHHAALPAGALHLQVGQCLFLNLLAYSDNANAVYLFRFLNYVVRQVSTGRAAGSYSIFLQPWRSHTSDVDAASEVITIRECHYVW